MKKYKLIKKLPFENSPKIGYISKSHTLREDSVHYYNGNWFYPDKYPEFWEEVVEKDYEILEVKGKYGAISSYIEKLDNDLKDKTIFKIKRLSDGEVFTVGDKVFSEYVNYTINEISIVNDKCMVSALYDTNNPNGSRLHYNLNNLKKVKKPLFTTEDGMDIFEGDEYFRVATENKIFNHPSKYIASINNQYPNNKYPSYHVNFSTKEKAEEYILMNKPCLSLNDIAKVYVSAGFEITKSNKNMKYIKQQLQLRELIKTKLKKAL